MSEIAIIGAGPAGLTAAHELSKLGARSTIIEADTQVGGISRTVNYNGYRFDIGGHRFFSKVALINETWQEILGEEFLLRPRLSRIHYKGHFFDYPLKAGNALSGLGPLEAVLILLSYAKAKALPHRVETNFEQWVTNRFGYRLYNIFFKTYTEKVWGIPCDEISAAWAAQRIKNLSLIEAVRNALFGGSGKTKDGKIITTLIDEFHYPRFGPGMMWERCEQGLVEGGNEILKGIKIERIRHRQGRVECVYGRNRAGEQIEIGGDQFISSMPLRSLMRCMDPAPPEEVLRAANQLRYRDYLTAVLIVNRAEVFPDNWIYIHSPEVKMGRIQNYKNWSPEMVPDDSKTSLGLEYFLWDKDEEWTWSDERLIEQGISECARIGMIQPEEVEDGTVVRMRKAYPVYDQKYEHNVGVVRRYLDGIANLQTIGRNGQHRYNNQDHSMLTGIYAARNITGEPHDIWNVNVEQEYHEETKVDATTSDRMTPQRVQAGATPPRSSESTAARTQPRWLVPALIALTMVLYGRGIMHSVGSAGDSFHHLINGIFLFDVLCHPIEALSDPMAFGFNYYEHFPAVNLGYYPPIFPAIVAVLMSVFGVSGAAAQLGVCLMAVMMTLFAFAWFRLRFDVWWSVAATVLLISTPHLVFWGRDIMLEIPVLAFMLGSVWLFERLLRSDSPTWRVSLAWALLAALAFWTKQHALLLLGVFFISTLASRRWGHLLKPCVLVSTLLVTLAAFALIKWQLALGGTATIVTVGTSASDRLARFTVLEPWIYYPRALPQFVGWHTLLLAPLGLFWVFQKREHYISPVMSWLVVFYLMNSYFSSRDLRYGVLWVPPMCALAVIGLKHLVSQVAILKRRPVVGGVLVVLLVGYSVVLGARVETPAVPTAYQRAAEVLADHMPPFSCLTYLPDRTGRPAVCFRLAVESRRSSERDIYSFGRMIRATQLHRALQTQELTLEEVARKLNTWNVKYILTEQPKPPGDEGVAEFVDGILALGEFRRFREYPIELSDGRVPSQRTLILYERIEPMIFRPGSNPEIMTQRIPRTFPDPALD